VFPLTPIVFLGKYIKSRFPNTRKSAFLIYYFEKLILHFLLLTYSYDFRKENGNLVKDDVKTDLAGDEKARFGAMKQAEKILLQDGAVAPLYQQGRSFIKGLVTTDFGGEFNYKWTEVAK
jgi:ABC-type oligopeptide transport system substrate-binding subunit